MNRQIVLMAGLLFTITGLVRAAETPVRFIQVVGEGEVKAEPDQAVFQFGLESTGRELTPTKDENASRTKELLSALRKAGVTEKEMQTSSVQIYPRYTTEKGKRQFVQYVARKNITVILNDLAGYGKVLDAALGAGVEEVNGPAFQFSNREKLERDATSRAAANARVKAEALAKDLNVSVGNPLEIMEANIDAPVPMNGMRFMKAQAMAAPEDTLAAGVSTVRATVTVKFALQ